jgi:hypothetical protein
MPVPIPELHQNLGPETKNKQKNYRIARTGAVPARQGVVIQKFRNLPVTYVIDGTGTHAQLYILKHKEINLY